MTTGASPSGNTDSALDLGKETVDPNRDADKHIFSVSALTYGRGTNGKYILFDRPRIRSIPPLVIGFLDLANSGDFAANVFNRVPVPIYAIVLMVIGATVALVMSTVALRDARSSWKNLKLLREERTLLESMSDDRSAELEINHRDLGTEIFDRAGVDIAMGVGAFLIAVGTYMAIGGANHRVWFASNLLSGYVGNALPAVYGICNVGWSVHVWLRARKQVCAVSKHLHNDVASQLLSVRIRKTQAHAIVTAIVCLVSGALSMVTPTHWWPYPVLLICGLAFLYSTWVYRTQIGYERLLLSEDAVLDETSLTTEILFLQSVKIALLDSPDAWMALGLGDMSMPNLLLFLVRCDLFEQLCLELLNDSCLIKQHFRDPTTSPMTLDQRTLLQLDKPEQIIEISSLARLCLEQHGIQLIKNRERLLLECLGACLLHQKGNDKDG
ncbi:unnamed protein product [Aureobasidium uvarum]|uniref:Integral membrane protein n=1 Tax=Aureobasidium uvarum TaxID=2773716 RepID=A0A9N8PPM4_9PEZI|nr:unnamed protein product [Aureobasidium uvarum]